jgi:hypothetical protein
MKAQSFWERRKAAVEAEARAERDALAEADAKARAAELEKLEDEAALAELGLPDPSTLGPGDDFAAFMRAGVPERFKRMALRRLWRSNPVLACVDGLNDYDDDYRQQALGQVVKTAYQVGKGMMAHVDEMKRQALAAEQGEASEPAEGAGHDAAPDTLPDAEQAGCEAAPAQPPEAADPVRAVASHVASEPAASDSQDAVPPHARRMRFDFDEERA